MMLQLSEFPTSRSVVARTAAAAAVASSSAAAAGKASPSRESESERTSNAASRLVFYNI